MTLQRLETAGLLRVQEGKAFPTLRKSLRLVTDRVDDQVHTCVCVSVRAYCVCMLYVCVCVCVCVCVSLHACLHACVVCVYVRVQECMCARVHVVYSNC